MYRNIFWHEFFKGIKISIFGGNQLKLISNGEVKNANTLNYRTFKPEPGGLFCEKLFGCVNNYICYCGNLKGKKKINNICKICNVTVSSSELRKNKLCHINLNGTFINTLFLKSFSPYISLLLNISLIDIKNILYNNYYLVIYSKKYKFKKFEVLNFNKYLYYYNKFNENDFYALTGFDAIITSLKCLDIQYEFKLLKKFFLHKKNFLSSEYKKNLKKYRFIENLINLNFSIEKLFLKVLPVIPPDLRPIIKLPNNSIVASDLNELYKKVIIRNTRLSVLKEWDSCDIILSHEKKLIQDSIDNLFFNENNSEPFFDANNRILKSLSSNIKGKFGIFRQNLLGKRVDYSGRSVIVSGVNFKINECGLPIELALELFRPFVYNVLLNWDSNFNIRLAKLEVDKSTNLAIIALNNVIRDKLVLLNRAPTLHRLGIQAFKPILTYDKTIKLNPLVCSAFNADFDGDQMAVHIPISMNSNLEFKSLMWSINNILHPSNGECCIAPTKDILLGLYYSSRFKCFHNNKLLIFNSLFELILAYENNVVDLNTKVLLRVNEFDGFSDYKIYETTIGRALIFNSLPKGFSYSYINKVLRKSDFVDILNLIYERFGPSSLIDFSDNLMKLGFNFVTQSGISISIYDIKIYSEKKNIVDKTKKLVMLYNIDYLNGLLSKVNKKRKILDTWELSMELISNMTIYNLSFNKYFDGSGDFIESESFNPIYMMMDSGARGSEIQIKQICCARGFVFYKDQGLMEIPVISSLREGLKGLEYFYFSHSSRKTLADTALKTSNAGYLTRRLVEVANNVIIYKFDCGTFDGINFKSLINKGDIIEEFLDRILGRVLCDDIIVFNNILYKRNTVIKKIHLKKIQDLNINIIKIRSPLTCDLKYGICALCYGYDLSKNELVDIGSPVGIIAAQSIGEPGTQLTMRTFHSGGAVIKGVVSSFYKSNNTGVVHFSSSLIYIFDNKKQKKVISSAGSILIKNLNNDELEKINIPYSSTLLVDDNSAVNIGDIICEWNPRLEVLIAHFSGYIKFYNFIENLNFIKRVDNKTGFISYEVLKYKKKLFKSKPFIRLCEDKICKIYIDYKLKHGVFIIVNNGDYVNSGDILVENNISTINNIDITGGLPKIVDLFEARSPKKPALLASISGFIAFRTMSKKKYLVIEDNNGFKIVNRVLKFNQVLVKKKQFVNKGDILVSGVINPHDILSLYGLQGIHEYLLTEIKYIYYLQGVKINDKHIEVIIKQMLRKVLIIDPGHSDFILGELVDKSLVLDFNNKCKIKNFKLIKYQLILSGITNSTINSESFLSAASFQQTLSVLSKAAVSSKENNIISLKENLMLGTPVPVGCGFFDKNFKRKNANFESTNKKRKKSKKKKGKKFSFS